MQNKQELCKRLGGCDSEQAEQLALSVAAFIREQKYPILTTIIGIVELLFMISGSNPIAHKMLCAALEETVTKLQRELN